MSKCCCFVCITSWEEGTNIHCVFLDKAKAEEWVEEMQSNVLRQLAALKEEWAQAYDEHKYLECDKIESEKLEPFYQKHGFKDTQVWDADYEEVPLIT